MINLILLTAGGFQSMSNVIDEGTQMVSTMQTMVNLMPIVMGVIIIMVIIGVVFTSLSSSNELKDDYKQDFAEQKAINPNHKQTYKEYVEERLAVEREMRNE